MQLLIIALLATARFRSTWMLRKNVSNRIFRVGGSAVPLVTDFHLAIGQFINYRVALKVIDPERTLFLAVPDTVYKTFF